MLQRKDIKVEILPRTPEDCISNKQRISLQINFSSAFLLDGIEFTGITDPQPEDPAKIQAYLEQSAIRKCYALLYAEIYSEVLRLKERLERQGQDSNTKSICAALEDIAEMILPEIDREKLASPTK